MAKFFKKLYTPVKETIEDEFIDSFDEKNVGKFISFKVKNTFKHSSGVLIKTEGSTHANGQEVSGQVEPEFKLNNYDVVVKGKVQTNNSVEGTLSFNNYLLKGSTFFLSDKISDKGAKSIEAGFDYLSKDLFSLNLKVTSPLDFDTSKIDLYAAAVGYKQGVSLGGDVKLNVKTFKPSSGNVYIEYEKKDFTVDLFGKYENKDGKEKKIGGFGYHQKINDKIRGAVDVSYDNVKKSSTVRFGSNTKLDDSSSLKARVAVKDLSNFRLGFVFKQTLFPSTKLTFTSDLNGKLLIDKTDEGTGHQFGVTLSFFD